jgi:hypothetical protein
MNGNMKQVMGKMIGDLSSERGIRLAANRTPRYRAFRIALAYAYTVCARQYYPKWASYLLDEEFQARGARRLRACYLLGVACFQPADLAAFWADQMGSLGEEIKQRHITELIPVASRFLRCLETELCAHPEFHPNLDCVAQAEQPMSH